MGSCCCMDGIGSKRMVDSIKRLANAAICNPRCCDHQTRSYSPCAEYYQGHQGGDETFSHSVFVKHLILFKPCVEVLGQ